MMKRSLLTDQKGVAALELALVAPFLILFFLGLFEISRYAAINQKLDTLTHSMGDFVTKDQEAKLSNLAAYVNTRNALMQPFAFSGSIIFSSVTQPNPVTAFCNTRLKNCIAWQVKYLGPTPSQLGNMGATPPNVLPTLAEGEDLIVAEVYYQYQPVFAFVARVVPSLAARIIYKRAAYKPRYGALTVLSPL